MGKSKAKKYKNKWNNNPTGLQSVKDLEKEEIELTIAPSNVRATSQNTLQNILEELQSGNEDSRLRALLGLSCLGDVELDRNALRTIAPHLVDHSPTVQLAAANALRMFVLSGGGTVADLMIEDDIMTPLIAQLIKQSEELFGGKPKGKDLSKTEVFIGSVRLLWTLCENSESALQHVNSQNILSILLAALQSSDKSVAIPAAQCLQTISEDNPKAVALISKQQDHLISSLGEEVSDPDALHLQALIAGLVVNMHYGLVSRVLPATTGIIVAVLSRCLSADISALIAASKPAEKSKEAPSTSQDAKKGEESEDEEADESMTEDEKPVKPTAPAKVVQNVGHIIDSQICALEILANICSNDDDDEGMDVSEGSEDALSESEAWDEDLACDFQSLSLPHTLPVEVHEALLSHGLLSKTMSLTESISPELLSPLGALADEEDIPIRLRKLQCRALLSLHNVVRGLSLEELGGAEQLVQAWKTLATKIVTDWHQDAEILEAATTSLRAITTRLAEESCGEHLVSSMTPIDLEAFCNLADKCEDLSVRVNVYRVVASLAAIVSVNFNEQTAPLLVVAGRFLLEQSARDTEVWVIAEALDSLMDALSEDCSDQACVELQLVQRLRALLPSLQHKIRANRRSLGGNLAVVTTVKANLARFIKYKAQRIS